VAPLHSTRRRVDRDASGRLADPAPLGRAALSQGNGPDQNLTMTPAPHTTSRVRRSGNQTPPSLAQASAPIGVPLLQTKLAGAPVLPSGGVTPPVPFQ